MSVGPADLLGLATALCRGATEVEWRASIGRAYYGAYHTAEAWHRALPVPGSAPGGVGVHETLIRCLTTPRVVGKQALKSRAIGYMLRQQKTWRAEADYDLSSSVDLQKAQTAVASAAKLIEEAV